jgi:hypothetical protein
MSENMSAHVSKFYALQAEATKEVMKMTFFLNYGGVAATLTAFGNLVLQKHPYPLILCLFIFILGLVCSVFMAIELRAFAYHMFLRAAEPSITKDELKTAEQNHRGRRTVYRLCITSLAFFALGIVVGFSVLFVSF